MTRVWPDVLVDMAGLLWWRGIVEPAVRLLPRPRPHGPGCPLCDPEEARRGAAEQ